MMRRSSVCCKYFNREPSLEAAQRLMGNGKFNLLVGPPSSGKTALMMEATPKDSFVLKLDMRAVDTTHPKFVCAAFCEGLRAASRDFQQTPATLKALTDLPPGVPEDGFDSTNTEHVVATLDFIVDCLLKDDCKVLIFIDEYAELFSKGKQERLMWKDALAHALEKVFIRQSSSPSQTRSATNTSMTTARGAS
jgi:hypothetical protein